MSKSKVCKIKKNILDEIGEGALTCQTLEYIDHGILDMIEQLDGPNMGYQLTRFNKEIKNKPKAVHIEYFVELLETVNTLSSSELEEASHE